MRSPRQLPRRCRAISKATRQTRLRAHVETRGWICEQWLPLWRALNRKQGRFSAELKTRIDVVRQAILKRIELMYQPELTALPEQRAPAGA